MQDDKVLETERFVVRARLDGDTLILKVHEKDPKGNELQPRGYMLGDNMLNMQLKGR